MIVPKLSEAAGGDPGWLRLRAAAASPEVGDTLPLPDSRQLRVAEMDGLRVARMVLFAAGTIAVPFTLSSRADEVARRNGAGVKETRADDASSG